VYRTQNQTDDWKLGSKGCYDAASLAKLQCKLELDFPSVAEVCPDPGQLQCASLHDLSAKIAQSRPHCIAPEYQNSAARCALARVPAQMVGQRMHLRADQAVHALKTLARRWPRPASIEPVPLLQGNLRGCVSKPLFPEVADVLTRETLKADPVALSRLMADHTQVLVTEPCRVLGPTPVLICRLL